MSQMEINKIEMIETNVTESVDGVDEVTELENIKESNKVNDLGYKPLTFSNWFFTFMCMNIPIIGLLYLIYLSYSKSQPLKRDFARAYLMYQVIFLTISIVLVFIFCYFGLELLDNALKLMQEL